MSLPIYNKISSQSSEDLWFNETHNDQARLNVLAGAITSKNYDLLEKLLVRFTGNINDSITGFENETLLWHALEVKDGKAASMLLSKGATLSQPLPSALEQRLKDAFEVEFYQNKTNFGEEGEQYFKHLLATDFESSLAYAAAFHYALDDPAVLELLCKDNRSVTFNVLKVFIRNGDVSAFHKVFPYYQNSIHLTDSDGEDLFFYSLGCCVKHPLTFERAQTMQYYLNEQVSIQTKSLFEKIFDDPNRFHEIWGLQRLLLNSLGASLCLSFNGKTIPIYSGNYPALRKHFQESLKEFMQNKRSTDDWVDVGYLQKVNEDDCLKMWEQKKIFKFSNRWSNGGQTDHHINAVIKYLFVCNRGDGCTHDTSGICIYEMCNQETQKELLKFFADGNEFYEKSRDSKKFVVSGLSQYKGLVLLKIINCETQKVGNCVWLSEKMGYFACFIASSIKDGHSFSEAIDLGRGEFKKWTTYDRLNILKAYLDHGYHLGPTVENEKGRIMLGEMIRIILNSSPKRLKAQYYDVILQKLSEAGIKSALGNSYDKLVNEVKFARVESALGKGDTAFALAFLPCLDDVNGVNEGVTLLDIATKGKHDTVVKELLKRGANPNGQKVHPLRHLIYTEGNEELIKIFIDIADLSKGPDLFYLVVSSGNEFAIEEMLKKGADPNLRDQREFIALHNIWSIKSEKVLEMLSQRTTNINAQCIDGWTPLHVAVRTGNEMATKFLLEKGANPNITDNDGETVLHDAEKQSEKFIEMLAQRCTNIDVKAKDGMTPLHRAVFHRNEPVVKLLLEKGETPICW